MMMTMPDPAQNEYRTFNGRRITNMATSVGDVYETTVLECIGVPALFITADAGTFSSSLRHRRRRHRRSSSIGRQTCREYAVDVGHPSLSSGGRLPSNDLTA